MLRSWLLPFSASSILLTTAAAQTPRSDGRPAPSQVPVVLNLGPGISLSRYKAAFLLSKPTIQKELGLTEEQKSRIPAIEKKSQVKAQEAFRGVREYLESMRGQGLPIDRDIASTLGREANESASQIRDSLEEELLNVLTRKQRSRFEEVRLQLEGPMAFLRPEVQKRFNLDEATILEIVNILDEADENERRLLEAAQPSLSVEGRENLVAASRSEKFVAATKKARESAQTARAATMQRIGRLLTKRQRDTYNKALGEPFDSTPLREPKKTDEPAK